MKKIPAFFLALMTSVALNAQEIVFTPQWTAQSQFAGYYAAYELGYYKQAGLDVRIVHPTQSNPTLNRLKEGSCNVITLELIQAMMANGQGESLVNILQTTQHSTLSVFVRNPQVKEFEDLKECRVGTWTAGFSEIPHMIDQDKNLNIRWISFMSPVNLFISGAIDATLTKTYNEKILMKLSGIRPGNIIFFSENGYDFPEDGVYVTRSFYLKNKEKCKAFAEASRKGWEWVRTHREEALDMAFRYIKAENVATNRQHQREMLDEILRVHEDGPGESPSFILKEEDFNRLNDALVRYGYLPSALDYDIFTEGEK